MEPLKNSYRFFRNIDCEYFPCHEGIDPSQFSCLFCYCPLYLMGSACGGNFHYVGEDQKIKDCSSCTIPHAEKSYDMILRKLKEAAKS